MDALMGESHVVLYCALKVLQVNAIALSDALVGEHSESKAVTVGIPFLIPLRVEFLFEMLHKVFLGTYKKIHTSSPLVAVIGVLAKSALFRRHKETSDS